MKPMGSEANQLVNAGREAFRPTEADRARLMAALAGTASLTVGAAVAAETAQRSLGGIFGLLPVARALVVALPIAAAGVYGWHSSEQSAVPAAPTARPVRQPSAVVPPKTAQPAVPAPETEIEPPRIEVPSAPVTPELRAPSVETPKPSNEIRQEVALLSKAQAALSRGRPQEALEALAEHAQRFPKGALTEERAATRARTLCALGRRQEAETELKRMEKLNPTSAYLARARESCGAR